MKGLTFDSFIVHQTNQAAFDICRKLAALDKDLPRPVVLLGEGNAGKSHLLWAIVNYYRENNVKVGVALISAKDFPKKVKSLGENADKLKQGFPVVLLVDDLDQFDQDIAVLEKVFFAFHDNGHKAVFATAIHPNVLPTLSGKFKAALSAGAIVGIKALPKSESSVIPEAAMQQISALKLRISELEKDAGIPSSAVPVEKQLDRLQSERDEALAALKQRETELSELQDEFNHVLEERNVVGDETEEWKSGIDTILNRLETQKAEFMRRMEQLDAESKGLAETLQAMYRKPTLENPEAEQGNGDSFTHLDIFAQYAQKKEDIEGLRQSSAMLTASLQEQEAELRRTIADIRQAFSPSALENTRPKEELLQQEQENILNSIAEQFQVLEDPSPDSEIMDEATPPEEAL